MYRELTSPPAHTRAIVTALVALAALACSTPPRAQTTSDAGPDTTRDGAMMSTPDGGSRPSELRVGDPCLAGDTCIDGFCADTLFQCPGVCQARGAAGASCFATSECAAGLVCDIGTCATPVAVGEPCDREHPCGDDALCSGPRDMERCVQLGRMGEACTSSCPGGRCTGGCVDGLVCVSLVCAPPVANGGACDDHAQCASLTCVGGTCASSLAAGDACSTYTDALACPAGTVCRTDEETFEDRCLPPAAEGVSCFSSSDCASGLVCGFGTSTCVPAPAIGEPCDFGSCGPGASCSVDDRCVAAGGEGEACDGLGGCDDGLTCVLGDSSATCSRPVAVGGACQMHAECASGACGRDDTCVERCER